MDQGNRKVNILFVLLQLSTGGAERVVLDLARNLKRFLFDVHVAFFSGGQLQGAFGEVCEGLFHLQKRNSFAPGAMLQLARIIHERKIDVINAHHYMPFFYSYLGSKILNRRRLIYTEHSVPEVEGIYSGKHKHICSMLLHKTDAVVGVSQEIADTFRKVFPPHSKKIFAISNGINVERFTNRSERDEVRAKWGFKAEHFVIGTVANFRKVKNHACLIRAFKTLSDSYPQVRLVLVGTGYTGDIENSEEEVRKLITSNRLEDKVILAGYREDIPEILHSFDAFCLPSFSEGLPVSILEAMAARVPVVGSNVRGIREVVSAEKSGLLFPLDDNKTLAQSFERLIKDRKLRDNLCENAFTFVSQKHAFKQWVSAYERLFQSL